MFDIGFWEITLIAIIALIVVGPDRLPEFARTAGLWIGRARRLFSDVKRDIDRELQTEELKGIIEPREFEEIHEIIEETKTAVTDAETVPSVADPPPGTPPPPPGTPPPPPADSAATGADARSLSDLEVRGEEKRDRDQNLL